jgi:HrpA-like RNA helicase
MNTELPIYDYRQQIVDTIENNPVTLISAETGAGKSTQLVQFLLEKGYEIIITQPRRLAASAVAERVAFECGCKLGDVVGYRTAYERSDSPDTRCLFCTDGLALVRELLGVRRKQILIIDEFHEGNLNIEVLTAWARKELLNGADFKLVIMSATMESDKLSKFFNDAPIISVPGRTFPVTEQAPRGRDLIEHTAMLLREGRNVLVFQPGKREINESIEQLKELVGSNAEILPLHGELPGNEQRKCFAHYSRPKCIVSTNVAQTSVTVDDIDAVVDSGMEKRKEVVDGVEGLYLRPISFADREQRKGRAGRCKPGIYTDWCEETKRFDFPVAEIHRVLLDHTVLRLAQAGFDMEELEFFHQPGKSKIHEAKRSLRLLGCMDDKGNVTEMGKKVSEIPLSVQFGRMIIEAEKLGVIGDVITIATIIEMGGITKKSQDRDKKPLWRKFCKDEETSDIMAQLQVWKKALEMDAYEMERNDIYSKAAFKVREQELHICELLKDRVPNLTSTGNRADILKAVCAGMVDHLYVQSYGKSYTNGDRQYRDLSYESVVRGGKWLVGLPFDIEVPMRRGGTKILNLITMATVVNTELLKEVAPHLIRTDKMINPYYDSSTQECISWTKVYFNGQLIDEHPVREPVSQIDSRVAGKILGEHEKRVLERKMRVEEERGCSYPRTDRHLSPKSENFNSLGAAFNALQKKGK